MPAVINKGMILGIKEHIRIGKDLNKKIIQKAINKKAQKIDSLNPLIIKLLPSKKVTLLPVISTWYLVVSKSALVTLSIFAKNMGNLALPISFMLTEILVAFLSLSINLFNNDSGPFVEAFTDFEVSKGLVAI